MCIIHISEMICWNGARISLSTQLKGLAISRILSRDCLVISLINSLSSGKIQVPLLYQLATRGASRYWTISAGVLTPMLCNTREIPGYPLMTQLDIRYLPWISGIFPVVLAIPDIHWWHNLSLLRGEGPQNHFESLRDPYGHIISCPHRDAHLSHVAVLVSWPSDLTILEGIKQSFLGTPQCSTRCAWQEYAKAWATDSISWESWGTSYSLVHAEVNPNVVHLLGPWRPVRLLDRCADLHPGFQFPHVVAGSSSGVQWIKGSNLGTSSWAISDLSSKAPPTKR